MDNTQNAIVNIRELFTTKRRIRQMLDKLRPRLSHPSPSPDCTYYDIAPGISAEWWFEEGELHISNWRTMITYQFIAR